MHPEYLLLALSGLAYAVVPRAPQSQEQPPTQQTSSVSPPPSGQQIPGPSSGSIANNPWSSAPPLPSQPPGGGGAGNLPPTIPIGPPTNTTDGPFNNGTIGIPPGEGNDGANDPTHLLRNDPDWIEGKCMPLMQIGEGSTTRHRVNMCVDNQFRWDIFVDCPCRIQLERCAQADDTCFFNKKHRGCRCCGKDFHGMNSCEVSDQDNTGCSAGLPGGEPPVNGTQGPNGGNNPSGSATTPVPPPNSSGGPSGNNPGTEGLNGGNGGSNPSGSATPPVPPLNSSGAPSANPNTVRADEQLPPYPTGTLPEDTTPIPSPGQVGFTGP